MGSMAGIGCLCNFVCGDGFDQQLVIWLILTYYPYPLGDVANQFKVPKYQLYQHLYSVTNYNVRYLVDPASSHMLVPKIKPCMSKYKPLYGETANGSLYQL
jgi:hypothetical protein